MPHDYEYMTQGVDIYKKDETDAQKEARRVKEIKEIEDNAAWMKDIQSRNERKEAAERAAAEREAARIAAVQKAREIEAAKIEAEKKSVCDFLNSLDDYFVRRLKVTKQHFTKYEEFDEKTLFDIMARIKEIEKKSKSFFTWGDDKKKLNSELELLNNKVSTIYSANTFVDDIYKTYLRSMGITFVNDEDGDKKFEEYKKGSFHISEFFSYLVNCKVVNTKDAQFKNKYLKYKQKYLSLKNKIN